MPLCSSQRMFIFLHYSTQLLILQRLILFVMASKEIRRIQDNLNSNKKVLVRRTARSVISPGEGMYPSPSSVLAGEGGGGVVVRYWDWDPPPRMDMGPEAEKGPGTRKWGNSPINRHTPVKIVPSPSFGCGGVNMVH